MSTNGTHPHALRRRRRVLVVGGSLRNIPIWARNAFDIELVDQYAGGGKGKGQLSNEVSGTDPEAIVVCVKFVSHNFSSQAHELGAELDIPVLKARGGWSTAVSEAARIGTDWFVDAVQRAGSALTVQRPDEALEALEVADNAWKAFAQAEQAKAEAAVKRMTKVQVRLDKVEGLYERLRGGAEQRVMAEIQRRARAMRQENGSALTQDVRESITSVIAEFDRAYLAARAHLTEIEKQIAEMGPDTGSE